VDAVGTIITERTRTEPYERLSRNGSHLRRVTSEAATRTPRNAWNTHFPARCRAVSD